MSVNGRTVREMGVKADPQADDIRVDGRRPGAPERHRYILLNKPAGVVTTRSDPQRRQTVLDLPGGTREYVYPVGRLDYDSEGLLLLTNDGDLAARLTHPRHEVERTYEAYGGNTGRGGDRQAVPGILLDGRRMPADVKLLSRPAPDKRPAARKGPPGEGEKVRDKRANGVLLITIREGRNRQVRRMCEAVGHPARKLRRVRIGPITDRRLRVGEWRELTRNEVEKLKTGKVKSSVYFSRLLFHCSPLFPLLPLLQGAARARPASAR